MAQDTTGATATVATASTVDGLRAVELSYRPIRSTADGDVLFFQSAMRLNGPTLGVLAPEDFMPVAESTGQAFPLFKLALVQLAQAIAKFRAREISFSWCSLAIPAAALGRLDCVKTICDLCETLKADPAKICFEIPQNALGDTAAAVNVGVLRQKGFHFMVCGFDGGGLTQIAELEADFVMLSPAATENMSGGERALTCVKTLLDFVNGIEAEPIACGIFDDEQLKTLHDMGCYYYAGAGAGKYVAERYVRRRN